MAYRDTERTVILRTRCGAERRIERFQNPNKIIEMPMRAPPQTQFIGDGEIPEGDLTFEKRIFEFTGQRGGMGEWIYEERPEPKPSKTQVEVKVDASDAIEKVTKLRDEMNRHTHSSGLSPAVEMWHVLEAFLPYGFQLVNVEARHEMMRDAVTMDMRVEVSGKSMAVAKCDGFLSRLEVLRQENGRLKAEKGRLRKQRAELRGANDKLKEDCAVMADQLANDTGRDKLAQERHEADVLAHKLERENDELRRNNGQLEYALATKAKELNAARSRYDAEVRVRQAMTAAAHGKRELYVDADGRIYGRDSVPVGQQVARVGHVEQAVVHIGSCEIASRDPDRFAFGLAKALDDSRTFRGADSGPPPGVEASPPVSALADVPGRQGPVQREDGLGVRQVGIDAGWD